MSANSTYQDIIQVRAQQNESVDALCFRVFGDAVLGTNTTEQVLDMNHGITSVGEVLPAGYLVTLPQQIKHKTSQTEMIQLWD